MKNYKIYLHIGLLLILFCSMGFKQRLPNPGQQFKKIAQNLPGVKDDLEALRSALFSEKPDFNQAEKILQQIRQSGNTGLLKPLQALQPEIKAKTADPELKVVDPFLAITINLEATILALDLEKQGLKTPAAKARRLIELIEQKFDSKGVINAETMLLQENATALTPDLLEVIDKHQNTRLKVVALQALQHSSAPGLEKELLKRAGTYKKDFPVYANLVNVLGRKGGSDTYNFLRKELDSATPQVQKLAKRNLQIMAENTSDPQLKARIDQSLKQPK